MAKSIRKKSIRKKSILKKSKKYNTRTNGNKLPDN